MNFPADQARKAEATRGTDIVQVTPPARSGLALCCKRTVQGVFLLLCLPRYLGYLAARCGMGRRAFSGGSESIARVPGRRGVYLRQAFYRLTLAACGRDIYFGWMSLFSMPEARLGERVYIGRFCSIGYADIGDEAMLADGVQVLSGGDEHQHDGRQRESMQAAPQTYRRVTIGRGAWIGAGAIVMADVGADCVIGSGAVVTRPIPAGCTAVGVPARVIRQPDAAESASAPETIGNHSTSREAP